MDPLLLICGLPFVSAWTAVFYLIHKVPINRIADAILGQGETIFSATKLIAGKEFAQAVAFTLWNMRCSFFASCFALIFHALGLTPLSLLVAGAMLLNCAATLHHVYTLPNRSGSDSVDESSPAERWKRRLAARARLRQKSRSS